MKSETKRRMKKQIMEKKIMNKIMRKIMKWTKKCNNIKIKKVMNKREHIKFQVFPTIHIRLVYFWTVAWCQPFRNVLSVPSSRFNENI
jgi:hypothetical protein